MKGETFCWIQNHIWTADLSPGSQNTYGGRTLLLEPKHMGIHKQVLQQIHPTPHTPTNRHSYYPPHVCVCVNTKCRRPFFTPCGAKNAAHLESLVALSDSKLLGPLLEGVLEWSVLDINGLSTLKCCSLLTGNNLTTKNSEEHLWNRYSFLWNFQQCVTRD